MYFDVRKHRGGTFRFRNHFLGPDNVPAFSGKEGDGGEEFICAQMLDSLSEKVESLAVAHKCMTRQSLDSNVLHHRGALQTRRL